MELAINRESAEALRSFAESMVFAVNNISEATDKIQQVHVALNESLGVHSNDFDELINTIKKAEKDANEAINALPPMLKKTAEKIEAYIDSQVSV